MKTLFTNETTIENIISSAGFSSEPRRKRSVGMIIAMAITVVLTVIIIIFLPSSMKLFGGIVISILMAVAVVEMWIKSPKPKEGSTKLSQAGFIRTGNSKLFSYSFTENDFTVSSDETETVSIEDIISVRDIGGAFQIKTPLKNYTLKKAGFSDGGEKKFHDLMIYKGVSIK
ncbi:MAG: hypothetical protein IJ555_05075 [Ruminococcus sp.]|nr:hypothetical protein [Ruminococcus sp.]